MYADITTRRARIAQLYQVRNANRPLRGQGEGVDGEGATDRARPQVEFSLWCCLGPLIASCIPGEWELNETPAFITLLLYCVIYYTSVVLSLALISLGPSGVVHPVNPGLEQDSLNGEIRGAMARGTIPYISYMIVYCNNIGYDCR